MKTNLVTATDFKAKCLACLNEIELHGETITITQRGKPMAVVGPPEKDAWRSPKDSWSEKAEIAATARVRRLRLVTSDQRMIESGLVGVVE
jgi:antitoxin (DNA-binding transcriptional repressor) of toxin-antitoxin stability system